MTMCAARRLRVTKFWSLRRALMRPERILRGGTAFCSNKDRRLERTARRPRGEMDRAPSLNRMGEVSPNSRFRFFTANLPASDGGCRHLPNRQKLPHKCRDDREILRSAPQDLARLRCDQCHAAHEKQERARKPRKPSRTLKRYRNPRRTGNGCVNSGKVPYHKIAEIRQPARAWRNGIRSGLKENLSARLETGDAELLKFGETLNGNPEPSPEKFHPGS